MSPIGITNSAYDLTLDNGTQKVGVMLYRGQDKPGTAKNVEIPFAFDVTDATQQLIRREVPRIWDNFAGGAGYSRRVPGVRDGYAVGSFMWCRDPRMAMPAGAVTTVTLPAEITQEITSLHEFEGDLFGLAGRYVIRIASGTGAPSTYKDLGSGFVADGAVVFNGDFYVGGSGGNLWKLDAPGGTWSQSADVARRKLAVVYWVVDGVGSFNLVGQSAGETFAYVSSDPTVDANWSADIAVGNTSDSIASVVAGPRHVYFVKPQGVHDVDARGYSPNLTPYWARVYNTNSGKVSMIHNGYIYAAHADFLDRVNIVNAIEGEEEPEQCTPGVDTPNETTVHGRITAMGPGVGGWIHAWVYNSTLDTSYLCAGKDRRTLGIPGPGPLLWHFSECDVDGRVSAMLLTSPSGQPRLWFAAMDGSTPTLAWQSQPASGSPYQDFLDGGTHTFKASAALTLSNDDWDDDAALKILLRHDLRTDNLGAGRNITLSTSADSDTYTSQGIARSSPRASFNPQSPVVKGYDIGTKLTLVGTSTSPPIVRSVKTRADVVPDLFESRSYTLCFGNNVPLRRAGSSDSRDPETVWADIQRLQTFGPFTFTDQFGEQYTAELEPGLSGKWVEGSPGEWICIVSAVITLQSAGFGIGANYNQGARYNQGYVYGAA